MINIHKTLIVKLVPLSLYAATVYTAPKEINFPQCNMKCSEEKVILRGIFHVVSCFPLHFMLYRGNLDYFSDSVHGMINV